MQTVLISYQDMQDCNQNITPTNVTVLLMYIVAILVIQLYIFKLLNES